jgi:Tfp pilus assembly protein PilP
VAETSARDPFKLPNLTPEASLQPGEIQIIGPLPPGSRGLIIGQLKLEGIVRQGKENPKMIAVLANPSNRAYFLHENDPLYNGVITKITPDSVYFREDVRDAAGKTSTREVVKKLAPAPGEKQQ